ncbi:hypothetical protein RJT34_26779 [Clitoria ternatea]|uniref:DUF7950 domain-containing protein n=1 Tax=Clitoria ternatea TaxID=43366 RepID=A0AAN9I9C3_CLITE
MLRFRPILPKPPTEAALSVTNKNATVSKRRAKRKYVRVRRKNSERFREGEMPEENTAPAAITTLQLWPDIKKEPPEPEVSRRKSVGVSDLVEKNRVLQEDPKPVRETTVVETWVTVESSTGTCMGEGGLGCTDAEKVRNIETDTCPGFVCDGGLRVRWVNDAYKRMVVSEEERDPRAEKENIVVRLKVKDGFSTWMCYSHPAFTCGVRLQYTWRNKKCTKMVPCDVWRLDCGGFAWRLDVKAALSLGL